MKAKTILLLLFTAFFFTPHAQTVYRLKYNSPVAGDTSRYDAYFSMSSNGTGFVRMKKDRSTAEVQLTEQYAMGQDGMSDTTMLVYEATTPVVVMGDKKIQFPSVTFWFKINAQGFFDPWAVTAGASPPSINNFIAVEFIRSQDITKNKNTVLNFFADSSAYYKNLFGPKSKGGSLTPEQRMNTRMFLVVVASTLDSTLIPYCTIDARRVVDMFTDIAKNVLGIRIFVDSIYGNNFNKEAVDNAIKKLKPQKTDLVVFYYSGHGFTDRNFKDKDFPFLDLRNPNKRPRPDARTQTLNIQDIYDSIMIKGARFNLVLSDCCNDTIEAKKPPGPKPPGQKGLTKASFENVKALFMSQTPVKLLMTAASKDERSVSTPSYSSYFTNFFVESLKTYLSPEKSSPNWFQVLGETQKQTRLYADRANWKQTPKLFLPR